MTVLHGGDICNVHLTSGEELTAVMATLRSSSGGTSSPRPRAKHGMFQGDLTRSRRYIDRNPHSLPFSAPLAAIAKGAKRYIAAPKTWRSRHFKIEPT
jgi:hypothetical protein